MHHPSNLQPLSLSLSLSTLALSYTVETRTNYIRTSLSLLHNASFCFARIPTYATVLRLRNALRVVMRCAALCGRALSKPIATNSRS